MPPEDMSRDIQTMLDAVEAFIRDPQHQRSWPEMDRKAHSARVSLGDELGHDPWLCTVCGRAPAETDRGGRTNYACRICVTLDARAAATMGLRMLLPLYDDPGIGISGTVLAVPRRSRTPGQQQLVSLMRNPRPLLSWRQQILRESVVEMGFVGRRDMSVKDWMRLNEWSPPACAADYVQVLLQLAVDVFDDDERLLDSSWLAEAAR